MISEQIIKAKAIIKELEQLIANPAINGVHNINAKLVDLDAIVQHMMIKWDKQ